jgi:hypothetical protein
VTVCIKNIFALEEAALSFGEDFGTRGTGGRRERWRGCGNSCFEGGRGGESGGSEEDE